MSTAPSRRVRLIIGPTLLALALYVCANVSLSALARWVENGEDGYTWFKEEWLGMFIPSNYEEQGPGSMMFSGASDAREAFLPDVFNDALPELRSYQNSISMGTMEVFLLSLRFLEQSYGADAMPDKIVLGITARFVMNKPPSIETPMVFAITEYSPHFSVETSGRSLELKPKDFFESLQSRHRFLIHQQKRYFGAARGLARALMRTVAPDLAKELWFGLRPSKYHHMPPYRQTHYVDDFRKKQPWGISEYAEMIREDMAALRDIAKRHDIDLYIVHLPRGSWFANHYQEGFISDLDRILEECFRGIPFLDLRDVLPDSDFQDTVHPTRCGAERVSALTAAFIRESDRK